MVFPILLKLNFPKFRLAKVNITIANLDYMSNFFKKIDSTWSDIKTFYTTPI